MVLFPERLGGRSPAYGGGTGQGVTEHQTPAPHCRGQIPPHIAVPTQPDPVISATYASLFSP